MVTEHLRVFEISPTYTLLIIIWLILIIFMLFNQYYTPTGHGRFFSVLIGSIFGIFSHFIPKLKHFTSALSNFSPKHYLGLLLIFQTTKLLFSCDAYIFSRSYLQIFILSIFGFLFCSATSGIFILYSLVSTNLSFPIAMMFGAMISQTVPFEATALLDDIPKMRHLQILITGESVFSEPILIIVYNLTIMNIERKDVKIWENILYVVRMIGGGLGVGLILGFTLKKLYKANVGNSSSLMFLTLFGSITSYHVSEELRCSGPVALIVFGLFIMSEKESLETFSQNDLQDFWNTMFGILSYVNYVCFGIVFIEMIFETIVPSDLLTVVISFLTVYATRVFAILLMSPFLSRIGYGIRFREAGVLALSVTRCGSSIFLSWAMMAHTNKQLSLTGQKISICLIGILILTTICTFLFTPWFIKCSAMHKISLARKKNMNACVTYIEMKTQTFISILKMDRFLRDSKWTIVNDICRLRHPYSLEVNEFDNEDETGHKSTEIIMCPECLSEIIVEPSAKEFADLTLESRIRILKARKISYRRQYESGMLSENAFRSLNNAIEIAINSKDALMKLNEFFTTLKYFQSIRTLKSRKKSLTPQKKDRKIPHKKCRRICYKMMVHPAFDLAMYIIIIINLIPILYDAFVDLEVFSLIWWIILLTELLFNIIYLIEFVIKILGYSSFSIWNDGVKTYFRSLWNIIEFVTLLTVIIGSFMTVCEVNTNCRKRRGFNEAYYCIQLLRFIRMIKIAEVFYNKIISFIERRLNRKITFTYEIGKGFVIGDEGIDEMMAQTIYNRKIRDECRNKMIEDKLYVMKNLGLVQNKKSWIANTVKTRQAIMIVINCMEEVTNELKLTGLIDKMEYNTLSKIFDEKRRNANQIKTLVQNSQIELFKSTSWINDDPNLADFLYKKVITKIYDAGEPICFESLFPEGVFIVISGLVKLTYIPKQTVLEPLVLYGTLPIVDFVEKVEYMDAFEEYISPGNSFGELSLLTKRPYDCFIYAETIVQTYLIKKDVFSSAFALFPDPLYGLEAKMWKTIAMRICPIVLMNVPSYHTYSLGRIHYNIVDGFVPDLQMFKIIGMSDLVEDVVLLEGVVRDYYTNDYYTGPCYIPRTVQKLLLPSSSLYNFKTVIQPRLFIIPCKNVDVNDLINEMNEISELTEFASRTAVSTSMKTKWKYFKKKASFKVHRKESEKFSKSDIHLNASSTTY